MARLPTRIIGELHRQGQEEAAPHPWIDMCPIGEIRGVAKRRVFDASILPIVPRRSNHGCRYPATTPGIAIQREGAAHMGTIRQVAAEDLDAAAIVDLTPALNDPTAHPWVWQPFGNNDQQRQEAIDTARAVSEYECAVVETVETREPGTVTVYTDQINLTVPAGYRFTVTEPDR